jgi:hypothetical protein
MIHHARLVKPAGRQEGGWPSETSRGRTRYGKTLIKHGGTGARVARNVALAPRGFVLHSSPGPGRTCMFLE